MVETAAVQVVARLAGDDVAQEQQRHKVRNSHERVHAVGGIPNHVKADNAAHEDHSDKQDAIAQHPAFALEVLNGAFAIIAPAQDRGEGKGEQAESEQRGADVGNLGKCGLGQMIELTITSPVKAQMTTVSQKVPVEDTRA